METVYEEIITFIVDSGKRILEHAGNIEDIGSEKKVLTYDFLTEEDLRIERGLKKIIKNHDSSHELFAEEEHKVFPSCKHVWIADPISGTKAFIDGFAHYAIVIAHMEAGVMKFAAVYDPSVDELFTARLGKGAFLNGKPIHISERTEDVSIILNLGFPKEERDAKRELFSCLTKHLVYRTTSSFAVSYCHVACGRYEGVLAFDKDAFPELASSLIIQEAGGIFTTATGGKITSTDREFIGGNQVTYDILKEIMDSQ